MYSECVKTFTSYCLWDVALVVSFPLFIVQDIRPIIRPVMVPSFKLSKGRFDALNTCTEKLSIE